MDYRFEWNNTLCDVCPRRAECIAATQTHRTLVVGEYHTLLQARRREMLTEAFKLPPIDSFGEGTQSELIRGYGLRHARYRSLAKTRLQNYLIGAACNLRRWFTKGSMGSGTDSLCPSADTGRRNRLNTMNKTCPHENGERSRPVK